MEEPPAPGAQTFGTTHWSLVVAAKAGAAGSTQGRQALEELCAAYWYPLYAFVRFRGYGADEAQDLTQSFFARIIETRGFARADPQLGRFRSYLLGAMKHFLANEWHRARAKKRGGGLTFLALDGLDPEARYALEPTATDDPDAGFDREWARETTQRAMEALRAESRARSKPERFEALEGALTGDASDRPELAKQLDMSPGALNVAVHRLRKRFREILRAEVAQTVRDPSDVEAEMRHLVAALRAEP